MTNENRDKIISRIANMRASAVNRAGFAGDKLLHFMRPYRARRAVYSS